MVGCSTAASSKNQEVAECQIWTRKISSHSQTALWLPVKTSFLSFSSQFTTSPMSGRACMASGSGTTKPGHPDRTEWSSGTAPAATFSSRSVFLQPSSSSWMWSSSCGGTWRPGPGSSRHVEPPISAASDLRRDKRLWGKDSININDLNRGNVREDMLKLLLGSFSGEKCWTLLESS